MANQYLSNFQIIGSSIKNLKIKNDFVSLANGASYKRKIDISHSVPTIELIDDEKTLSGILLLNIKVSVTSNKKKYSVDMCIEGCFNAPAEIGEEVFRNMVRVNGITSLYSIARGFIQSTTSQTLVSGSVLLPMFNVAAYSEDLDSQKADS